MISLRATFSALVLIALASGSDASAPAEPNACSPGSVCASTNDTSLNDASSLLQVHSSTIYRSTEYADSRDLPKDYSSVADIPVLHTRPSQLDFEELTDRSMLGLPTRKEFVYIRHGESMGNKASDFHWASIPTLGIWNAALGAQAADGVLTSLGEAQPVQRVLQMDNAMLQRISETELVVTSPLRRAMATSLIVIAEVLRRCPGDATKGMCAGVWPTDVQVSRYVREKVKTGSEWPGCGGDPLKYIDEIVAKYIIGLEISLARGLFDIGDRMKQSYIAEKKRATTDKTFYRHSGCLRWDPMPEDGATYQKMITHFKDFVLTYPQTKTLIVAHSGWARYAFSPWLPDGVKTEKPATTEQKAELKASEKALKQNLESLVKARDATIKAGYKVPGMKVFQKEIATTNTQQYTKLAAEYQANRKAKGEDMELPEDHLKHVGGRGRSGAFGELPDPDHLQAADDQHEPLSELPHPDHLQAANDQHEPLLEPRGPQEPPGMLTGEPGQYVRVKESHELAGVVQNLDMDGHVLVEFENGHYDLFRPDELEPVHDLNMSPLDAGDPEDDGEVDMAGEAFIHLPVDEGDLRRGGRKIRPLNNAGFVTGEIDHVPTQLHAVFKNVVVDTIGPCGHAYPNTENHGKWGMFNNMFEPHAVTPQRIPDGSCQVYSAFEKQMAGRSKAAEVSTSDKWETRILFLSWAPGGSGGVLSWGDQWGEPKGLMHLVSATLAKDGESMVLQGTLESGDKVFTIRRAKFDHSPNLQQYAELANRYLDPETSPCTGR